MFNVELPSSHPESLLNIRVKAKLLTPPFTVITFQYSQIDWPSHHCEPNGILVNHYYPPNHRSAYGSAALIDYSSMRIELNNR